MRERRRKWLGVNLLSSHRPGVVWLTVALCPLFCTYDSTPPGDEKINDSKPLLMLDATGFSASRSVKLQYTDTAGSTTQQTSAEKTDSSGRFLYPLYLARGTRTYSLTITVDENGDGSFCPGGDKTYTQNASLVSDTEVRNIQLSVGSFSGC